MSPAKVISCGDLKDICLEREFRAKLFFFLSHHTWHESVGSKRLLDHYQSLASLRYTPQVALYVHESVEHGILPD